MPNQNNSNDIITKAVAKINSETKDFSGNQKAKIIHTYVSNALINFCKQNEKFAEVVLKTKRTLSECCKYCLEGVTTSISDIDTYRRAVQFYFPSTEIEMNMTIKTGDVPSNEYINKKADTENNVENKKAIKANNINEISKSDSKIAKQKTSKKVNKNSKKNKKKDGGYIQLSLFEGESIC